MPPRGTFLIAGHPPVRRSSARVTPGTELEHMDQSVKLKAPKSLLRKVVVVTGGAGYLGQRITYQFLAARVGEVRAIDLAASWKAVGGVNVKEVPEGVQRIPIDICDKEALRLAMVGADVIVHTASYGMSGPSMLNVSRIHEVNVGGTQNVIDCAAELGVAVIYTSSYNVVFGGRVFDGRGPGDGDPEASADYCPDEIQVDEYSRTKAKAEQLVLSAVGTPSARSRGGKLRCCAIRPAAIYGAGEQRHMPRIVDLLLLGQAAFNIGSPDSKCDWVHADNVARAHVLAAGNLLWVESGAAAAEGKESANGLAFFISDCHPMNNFEFLRPVIEGVGGPDAYPRLWIPYGVMFWVAAVFEVLYSIPIVRWIFYLIPLATRAEVQKVAVTHWFANDRARRVLGYEPVVSHPDGIVRVARRWKIYREQIEELKSIRESKLGIAMFCYYVRYLVYASTVYALAVSVYLIWRVAEVESELKQLAESGYVLQNGVD